jgi:hypothetical protein
MFRRQTLQNVCLKRFASFVSLRIHFRRPPDRKLRVAISQVSLCRPSFNSLVELNSRHAHVLCSSAQRSLSGCYKTCFHGLGMLGQDHSTCILHCVVLITTRSRSVFRRMYTTKTSRRSLKGQLLYHTSVTSACCLKTHAMAGRSKHAGKSRCRSDSVTAGRCQPSRVSSGARRQRKKADLLPFGSCSSLAQFPLCSSLLHPKEGLHALWFLAFGSGETQKNPSPPEPPLRVGGVLSSVSQRSSLITRRLYASGYPGWLPRR